MTGGSLHLDSDTHRPGWRLCLKLCLNGTLPCVDFMEVTMGDIGLPYKAI